jgi:hypothetical protein
MKIKTIPDYLHTNNLVSYGPVDLINQRSLIMGLPAFTIRNNCHPIRQKNCQIGLRK